VRLKLMMIWAVSFCLLAFVQAALAAPRKEACDLPSDLQREVAAKYPGAKLVTLPDLDEDDRVLFQKEHADACPGLVNVDFYGGGEPTLALVFIANARTTEKAELVLAREVKHKWETAVLDAAESSVPVVWSQGPGKYKDVYGRKVVRATRPVIVFCGYNSWAILYAWTGTRVAKIWLRD